MYYSFRHRGYCGWPSGIVATAALAAALVSLAPTGSAASAIDTSLQAIRAVGPEGRGNAAATTAWQELAQAGPASLVQILTGMDGASPVALNWLRAAVDAIAARESAAGHPLPVAALEKFIAHTSHHPRARRLAYELIAQADPPRAEALIEKMLNDPAGELRRDAVARAIADAKRLQSGQEKDQAIARYSTALSAARDVDQIETIATAMKDLGQPVQLARVFGWLAHWQVIGPFDNTKNAGFTQAFPPEEKIDLQAKYEGKSGEVRWLPLATTNEYGLVDLNQPLGALKSATGYAYTEIESPRAQTAELRLGCKNGWKVWFNGSYLFGRDEYHRGAEIDQYRFKVQLKPGPNRILVKVCQNEQVEDWTKEWEFQMRLTDDLGAPIDLARR